MPGVLGFGEAERQMMHLLVGIVVVWRRNVAPASDDVRLREKLWLQPRGAGLVALRMTIFSWDKDTL